jgi:hypothetical protein
LKINAIKKSWSKVSFHYWKVLPFRKQKINDFNRCAAVQGKISTNWNSRPTLFYFFVALSVTLGEASSSQRTPFNLKLFHLRRNRWHHSLLYAVIISIPISIAECKLQLSAGPVTPGSNAISCTPANVTYI